MSEIRAFIEKAINLKNHQDFEKSLDILENLYKEHPESQEIKENLVDVLFSFGFNLNDELCQKYEEAIKYFLRILEIDKKNYRAYYNLGIAYFNLDMKNEALRAYDESLKIKPDYEHVYYNKGLIYELMEKNDIALSLYKKALEINPKFIYAAQAQEDLKRRI